MLALQQQLDLSQWWPPEHLRQLQFRQLHGLLVHCLNSVPFYRGRLEQAGFRPDAPLTEELWSRLPLLTREDIQLHGQEMHSNAVPKEHGKLGSSTSSGSTGKPVTTVTTQLADFFWHAITLRHARWHRPDFSGKLAVIRATDDPQTMRPEGLTLDRWGPSIAMAYRTGPAVMMSVNVSAEQKLEWLQREDPDYLLSYPTSLGDMLEVARDKSVRLERLKTIETLGGLVSPAMRSLCRELFGLPISDTYSAQEIGYLALQCPEREIYLLQSECNLVEVLDEEGVPCAPGQVGRVVVTPFHNFAMPLIRYAIGDYAEVGEPSPCGRGLPVLNRIMGRQRNLLILPDGRRVGPKMNETRYRDIAPVRQFQLIQKSLERLEVRLAVERPVTPDEERRLSDLIRDGVGTHFELDFVYLDEIERHPNGKFEDFKSELELNS